MRLPSHSKIWTGRREVMRGLAGVDGRSVNSDRPLSENADTCAIYLKEDPKVSSNLYDVDIYGWLVKENGEVTEKRVGNVVAAVTLAIGLAFVVITMLFVRVAVDTATDDVGRYSQIMSDSLMHNLWVYDTYGKKNPELLDAAISAYAEDDDVRVTVFGTDKRVLASTDKRLAPGDYLFQALPDEARGAVDRLEADKDSVIMQWTGLEEILPHEQELYLFRYSPDADCYVLVTNRAQGTFSAMRQQVTTLGLCFTIVMFTLLFLMIYIVRAYQQRVIRVATTDELTGLANRKAFSSNYAELEAEQRLDDCTLALVDVDLFKSINDTYGHAGGDEALAAVAGCIAGAAGSDGLGGRWGGDEFIVVVRGAEEACFLKLKEMIESVRELDLKCGAKVSISVGAARIQDKLSLEQVVERADDALYVTKEGGRGFLTNYQEGVTPHMVKNSRPGVIGASPAVQPQTQQASDAGDAGAKAFPRARRRLVEVILSSLLAAVEKMVPFVAAGGIFIALAFLVDGAIVDLESLSVTERANFGSITPMAAGLKQVGSAAFNFMLPIFAAFFAMNLGGPEAFMAGFAGGYLASTGNSGFIGAIMAGVVSAGICNLMRGYVSETRPHIQRIAPILLYPLFSLAIMYLIMHFFIEPVATSLEGFLSGVLSSMKDINRVSLGALLGAMMATDLGGFINKCAYHFGTASIATGDTDFMAAVMVGGMVPPIGIALSMIFFRSHFTVAERNRGPATLIMGLAFITEGAIPFAITDFAHTFMSSVLGSAVAGGLSCYFGCTLVAPHGGIFVFPVVGNLPFYLLSLAIGSLVTAVALGSMKPVVEEEAW